MRKRFRVFTVVLILLAIAVLLWLAGVAWHRNFAPEHLNQGFRSAVAGSEEFVRSRVTGGVGVVLRIDAASGMPVVNSVIHGSPAENAGLQGGDVITRVNDLATAGQPLARVVETMRGITGGKVTLSVRRAGSTNLALVIQRSSWNSLGITNALPTIPRMIFVTNPGGTVLIATNGANQR